MNKHLTTALSLLIISCISAEPHSCASPCSAITPPARPYPAECWGFYFNVDPLIWQAHVNGTGIAIKADQFNSKGKSQVQNLNFVWDWGVRLGLGLNTTHDAWDILLQWTRWKTNASKNTSATKDDALFPRIQHPNSNLNPAAQNIRSKWDMNYNILDLENGREFYVSNYLSLRPFAGLRSAWVDQDWDVRNSGLGAFGSELDNFHDVFQSNRFWGIGIRGGLNTQWGFCGGWSLFSNYSASLLYGYYSIKHLEKGDPGDPLPPFKANSFYHVGTSIIDMQLGLRFDWISCDCCYHIGFDLGWEHHWHPGQNQFLLFVDDTMEAKYVANQGDLGIQGFFLKARFDF